MVRTILSTLVMTAGMLAVSGSTAYAEEACVKAAVIQNTKPGEIVNECHPTPFPTHATGDCVVAEETEVCFEVTA